MKTTEILLNFFRNIYHNYPRVAQWYTPDMEVQINVAPCGGEQERPGVYFDSEKPYKWYNVRIPKNANTEPLDNDSNLAYPLDIYVDAIGMTGWDWRHKQSIRFGFDYDAITGHAAGVGISESQLNQIKNTAFDIPELLILRSTSGTGLHLYLECDPNDLPQTATHTEHSALALAALQDLSSQVGFDFGSHLDVGGGNMWVWAKKMNQENKGLTLLKDNINTDGTRAYYKPPDTWRNFLDVAKGRRKRSRLFGVSDEDQEQIDKQNISQTEIALLPEHERLIADLHIISPETTTAWIPDQKLLQTHTYALKKVFQTKTYKGVFDTLSEGKDLTKPNCFGYPKSTGGWRFIRFGKGTNEAPSWATSEEGWTYCIFNEAINLELSAKLFNGTEDDKGGYVFSSLEEAVQAAESFGSQIEIPEELQGRDITFRTHKDGRLLVEVVKRPKIDDDLKIQGWLKKKSVWYKLFESEVHIQTTCVDLTVLDKYTRSLITPQHEPSGWSVKHSDGYWIITKKDDAKTTLSATPMSDIINPALATALQNSWTLVNLPFQDEYPGGRKWNLHGAQFKFKAAELEPDEQPIHPHWDLILNHCGNDLTQYLKDDSWAQENNIRTGSDYLLAWIVSMYRTPFQPLPYLFFWGPENSGKSTLHAALSCLMSKGVVKADTALTSKDGFNGELEHAILCVVEEKNISRHPDAHARLKEWVTAKTLSLHPKFKQVYTQDNSTHWMHMANFIENCPIFPGDTRIVSINVQPFLHMEIPEPVLMDKLREEAPHFMVTLQRFNLPEPVGRLRLPVIVTSSKLLQQEANRNPLEAFLEEYCFYAPGLKIPFKDFYAKFVQTLSEVEKNEWSKRKIISSLKENQPFGQCGKNARYIGNISFEPPVTEEATQHFIRQDDRLILIPIK